MDLELIPKVFVLNYEISEEDHGSLAVFNSYDLAKQAKIYAEKETKVSNRFIRFRIDVYEVESKVPTSSIDAIVRFGFFVENLNK